MAARCAFEPPRSRRRALPVQTLILASSFAKKKKPNRTRARRRSTTRNGAAALPRRRKTRTMVCPWLPRRSAFGSRAARRRRRASRKSRRRFAPRSPWTTSPTRAHCSWRRACAFLPPARRGHRVLSLESRELAVYPRPVAAMVGLTMSAMPPAQNMVLLTISANARGARAARRRFARAHVVLAVAPCTCGSRCSKPR